MMTPQEIRTSELAIFKERLRAQLDDFHSSTTLADAGHGVLAAGLCLGSIHHLLMQQILTAPEAAAYQVELRDTFAERWPTELPTFDELARRD